MPQIEIAELEFTDHAIDKLWAHRIDPEQLYAVLANRHVITRNRRGRAAPHMLIGRDDQGRCLAIPSRRPMIVWSGGPSLPGTANQAKSPSFGKGVAP